MAAVSLLSSWTTVARASGFTPASSSCTHTRSVSSSRPVFRRSEISLTAVHRGEQSLATCGNCKSNRTPSTDYSLKGTLTPFPTSNNTVSPPTPSLGRYSPPLGTQSSTLGIFYYGSYFIALLSLLFMASLASESRSAEVDAAGVLAAILDYVTMNSNQWNMEKSPNQSEREDKQCSAVALASGQLQSCLSAM